MLPRPHGLGILTTHASKIKLNQSNQSINVVPDSTGNLWAGQYLNMTAYIFHLIWADPFGRSSLGNTLLNKISIHSQERSRNRVAPCLCGYHENCPHILVSWSWLTAGGKIFLLSWVQWAVVRVSILWNAFTHFLMIGANSALLNPTIYHSF